jgi:hypothetical protein
VQDNFSFVVLAIIVISVLPGVYEFLRARYGPPTKVETTLDIQE